MASTPHLLATVLQQAAKTPAAPALDDPQVSLDYAHLLERVKMTAAGLHGHAVGPGDRVAIDLGNCADFVWIALACLWVGAAFVPIDPHSPPARKAQLVRDCGASLLVRRANKAIEGPTAAGDPPNTTVTYLLSSTHPVPAPCLDPNRDAYLIYTSGTTGSVKGVAIPERSFASSVHQTTKLLGLDAATRALAVSPFHFDGSYGLVFPTLASGGSLVVPRREDLLFLKPFFDVVLSENITLTSFSPSYLRLLVSSRHLAKLAPSRLSTLMLGGEPLSATDISRVWQVLPGLRVFNRYGPTEATIAVTTYLVKDEDVSSGQIPLGAPHPGVDFFLASEQGTLLTGPGETGELYIAGAQLMSRYWGDDELTRSVLTQDLVPGKTLYKTGDLAWRDERGLYFYGGRLNDVVKRNGVRISLAEVAAALGRYRDAGGVACVLTDLGGRAGITAFVEGRGGLTERAVIDAAREHLPPNALPDEVVIIEALPLTTQGKVDHRRLLAEAGKTPWRDAH